MELWSEKLKGVVTVVEEVEMQEQEEDEEEEAEQPEGEGSSAHASGACHMWTCGRLYTNRLCESIY